MDTTNPAQSTIQNANVATKITINDIQLRTPARRRLLVATRYQIQFSVDDTPRSTKQAKEKMNCVSWNENLYFDGNDRSVFLVKVYRKPHIGPDKLLGSLTDSIGGILEKLKNGVLEEPLEQDTSNGKLDSSRINIKFALTAEKRGDIGGDELQATDAVNKATEMISALGPTPQIVGAVDSAINTGQTVVTKVQTFENTWGVLLQRMALFNQTVAGIAQIHPYTSLAWSVISAANQVLINQQNRDDRVIRLAGTMSDVFTFVEDAECLKEVKAHTEPIKVLIQQVTECGYFIAEYAKQNSFWTRTAKYTFSDVDAKITDYENKLRDLKAAFLEGVTLQSGVTVFRMMNVVQNIAESVDLNDVPYAAGARYAEEKGCLSGTREYLIREICDILNNPDKDAPRVCLLTGVAGSGKSAVAHSIARLYDGQERLGSSYCFLRSDVTRRNPQNFFSTIALDLSDHDPQYKAELCRVVKNNRSLRTSESPSEQVRRLIIDPTKHLHTIGPLIIVVDALDESGGQSNRKDLLLAFFEQITENNLPTNLRFLITARPERDILDKLPSGPQIVHKQMGDIAQDIVDEDIDKFIRHSLHQYTELESAWPNQEWCRLLVRHSQHLFQWASTACKFIEGDGAIGFNIRERLKILLQHKNDVGVHPLDELYRTILGQLFTLNDAQHRFREVMAVVLVLKEPLSLTSLSALFDRDTNIQEIIKPMGSLLDGALNEQKPIRPLHTSFGDFLLDDARSSTFHVNLLPHHSLHLGRALLACMRQKLKFNICDLKDSRLRNTAIPDLAIRVTVAIPPYLAYSCQYWMDHLQHTQCIPESLDEVTSFFKNFFPFWLEVISLLSLSSPVSCPLAALRTCTILKQWAKGHEIASLATEAIQFIQLFAPIIRESTPHLYLSAMPQTPSSSPLSQIWANNLQSHLSVILGHPAGWPGEVHTLQGHTDDVMCVAYSPDGSQVVSGSADRTMRVWNPTTGQHVATPSQLHTAAISSVAYSPDGCHIVSASRDRTIRVWDAKTGQCIAGPLQEHTQPVTCVAYSPNGEHIASGSNDKTIRIWSANTGHCVVGLFQGHTDSVNSLAYSHDGCQIVSGSRDTTIRIWNAYTGQCVADPLLGHTSSIFSVAYSPDGSHIVSGSHDNTIKIWNLTTGKCEVNLFQGHIHRINSVAYSPDGRHIVSASSNFTIMIWNADNGQHVAGPIQGHTGPVTSAIYSSDGSYIVSGSWDKTVRVWNANTGHPVATTSQGHTNRVTSVAYSPDGSNIVSGSLDWTIQVWNAATGQYAADPFHHTHSINSVIYSPDGTHIIFGSGANITGAWNPATGQCVVSMAVSFERHTDPVLSVACSPDGSHIVSGSEDRTIRIWDTHTGQCVADALFGHTRWVYSVAYSPDGSHIASGAMDNTIRVWDSTTGQCVANPFQGHTDAVHSIAYSPNGSHIVSGSRDKTIRVWNAVTGQCVAGPFQGHTNWVLSVAYSPNGNHIVSGSEDNTIRIWDPNTGQCMAGPFQGHTRPVNSVAFSPDGSHIVSGSADFSIKVWALQDLILFGEMHQQEDGWIELSDGACFCWIPSWARHAFYLPVHTLVTSSHHTYKFDFSDFLYGESWVLCWK
ncbi:WD40-repeat-containing domain protein [Butyriboletus roseoflavus]|nr:WD40-repeat-containing domain protein [Butyriboletus roseoflavus]